MDTLLLLQPQSRRGRPVGAAPEDRPADGAPARPPARRPRVAHHVRQEVMLAAAAVRGPAAGGAALPVLTSVHRPCRPRLPFLPPALAAVFEAVDGEEGDGADEGAGEADVVAGLGLRQVDIAYNQGVQKRSKLGNVWIFVQLIHRPTRTEDQLYKTPNIAKLVPFCSPYL